MSCRRLSATSAALYALAAGPLACAHVAAAGAPPLSEPTTRPPTLEVRSTSLGAGGELAAEQVFAGMGCTGANRSPQLSWRHAPADSRSFAIIMHDPDAPTGVGFFHWTLANVPASVTDLAPGELPPAARLGLSDVGTVGYAGACPPPGPGHRYVITVYALDVDALALPEPFTGALLRFVLRDHTLAHGRLVGTYQRPG